mmetsp:Transcript_63422/g.112733  ORF Transcript_63422/g.112733 Transcript_63422/m.112733 type:complete len:187 (-) Transcript_63422:16-576(-)
MAHASPWSSHDYHATVKEHVMTPLGQLSTRMDEKLQDLEYLKQLQEFQGTKDEKLEHHAAAALTKVKLDIGGKSFHVSRGALLRWEGTFFYDMLANVSLQPSEDEPYFIDRDPIVFDRVVQCLRSGEEVDTRELSKRQMEILRDDLAYYQIPTSKWELVLPPQMTPRASTLDFSSDRTRSLQSKYS